MKNKIKLKKGDEVIVLSGKDKGKTGKIVRVIPDIRKVIVADVNKSPIEMLGHVTSSYYSPNLKKSIALGVVRGGKNMIGPNLWNVIGRTAGSVSDYKYSKAMVAYAKEWSFEEMNSYLIKPQAYIKGTKMAFAGLRKEKDRASVILYMNSKGDNPKPLP